MGDVPPGNTRTSPVVKSVSSFSTFPYRSSSSLKCKLALSLLSQASFCYFWEEENDCWCHLEIVKLRIFNQFYLWVCNGVANTFCNERRNAGWDSRNWYILHRPGSMHSVILSNISRISSVTFQKSDFLSALYNHSHQLGPCCGNP